MRLVIAAGLVLGVVPGLLAAPKAPPPTAGEFLVAATALTLQREFDQAERLIRKGRASFPAAQGFHLKLGDVHRGRNHPAEAFYEYQWEVLRAGDGPSGIVAAQEIAKLLTADIRGPEVEELHTVLLAASRVTTEPKDAAETLERVQAVRGPRFALRLFLAEAKQQSRQYEAAATIFRSLLAEDPLFVPAYVELAGVLRLQGKADQAAALDAKARAIDAKHPSFRAPLPIPSATPPLLK